MWNLLKVLVLIGGAVIAVSGCKRVERVEEPPTTQADVTPEPASPTPAATPEPQKGVAAATPELNPYAPPGVFFLRVATKVETDSGVIGFPQGTKVIKQPSGKYLEPGGHLLALKSHEVTNDLRTARQLVGANQAAQAALKRMQETTPATTKLGTPPPTPMRRPAAATAQPAATSSPRRSGGTSSTTPAAKPNFFGARERSQ